MPDYRAIEPDLCSEPDCLRVATYYEMFNRDKRWCDSHGPESRYRSDGEEFDVELADAESSRDAAWEVQQELQWRLSEMGGRLSRLWKASQMAYDWKCGDIAEWDAKYHHPWGKVNPDRDIWEPLADALRETLHFTTVAPVTVGTYARCVHWQCAHLAIDHGTDQEVDLDGRPTSPEFLVCFACLKVSDSPGVYSHDFEPPRPSNLPTGVSK